MADTTLATASQVQVWDSKYLSEYVRASRFKPYMGKAEGDGSNPLMPIMVKTELQKAGKTVNIPLLTRLQGDGVQGNERLSGSEEAISNYNFAITVNYNRNAISIPEADEHWTEMDLRGAAKMLLRTWSSEVLRDDLIIGLADIYGRSYVKGRNASTLGTRYTPTTFMAALNADQTNMDAWVLANRDRILYGPDLAHMEADSDHSDSVVKLTVSTDKASAVTLRLAKGLAKTADPHIRPIRVNDDDGREFYVWFVGTADFGNLKQDADIKAANIDARTRGIDNHPIFQDGDLIYDGVIIREVPEIPNFGNVGASSAAVTMSFFCGAQAASVVWGMKPQSRVLKEDDYGHFYGTGITECRGTAKNFFNSKQHGLVTVFSTAA
jgi:hypothetical protein